MQHKHILKSLPLLASILGRKYGVEVRIGGDSAYTDGNVIQLPSLPLDCDTTLLGMIRGLLDHEASHIRHTDFPALKAAKLSPLEKHIWNIFEDWRAENKMAAIYPGCRDNFQWLIRHMFMPKDDKEQDASSAPGATAPDTIPDNAPNTFDDPAMLILEWILITVRSWDLADLYDETHRLRADIEQTYPGLAHELEQVLLKTRTSCQTTEEAIKAAREAVRVIKKYLRFMLKQTSMKTDDVMAGDSGQPEQSGPAQGDQQKAMQSLRKLLSASDGNLPKDMGTLLGTAISSTCKQSGERLKVAIPMDISAAPMLDTFLDEARQASTALRTRLHGLVQSTGLTRNHSGYSGKIDTRKLHSLVTGNARIFLRHGEKRAANTAIHILLDVSGSMGGRPIKLAGQACFAVASALQAIKGVSVGVTTFPGGQAQDTVTGTNHWDTVCPILPHGSKVHRDFSLIAHGSTPMDTALWWTLQTLIPRPETRKIILIVTDGCPDCEEDTIKAITAIKSLGFEVYGIGITTDSIKRLLPGKESRQINLLDELAPNMFELLQGALVTSKD